MYFTFIFVFVSVFVHMCADIHWVLKRVSEPTELQMMNESYLSGVSANNWVPACGRVVSNLDCGGIATSPVLTLLNCFILFCSFLVSTGSQQLPKTKRITKKTKRKIDTTEQAAYRYAPFCSLHVLKPFYP